MLTAGGARVRGRDAPRHEEALAQRLQQASDTQLQQLAQYRRPKWQTLTLRALAVEDDDDIGAEDEEEEEEEEEEGEDSESESDGKEGREAKAESRAVRRADKIRKPRREPVVVTQQPLEVMEGASLADVRKLIQTFCATKIPSRFVFAAVHRRRLEGYAEDETDERGMVVEDALDDSGVLVVLIPTSTSRSFTRAIAQATASTASASPTRSREITQTLPSFSASRIVFGAVSAAVNVFIRRSEGVTLELSAFCDQGGVKIDGLSTAELTMQLIPKVLAQRVGMTESMLSILLSSSRGQSKILKKLLAKLHLYVADAEDSGGEKELRWQWTAQNVVGDSDLHTNRRSRAIVQDPVALVQATVATQEEEEERRPSTPPMLTTNDEDIQLTIPQAVELADFSASTSSMPVASISSGGPGPIPKTVDSVVPKAVDEEKARLANQVRSKPVGTPPEKKKPDSKPLVRKTSVDVNAIQVRGCLEIGATTIGDDVPSCFSLQMIFIELMLRDFASSSLPVFVSEIRPALKEVYRSSSQTSTPDIVVKSIDLLWAGLSVAFWESKINQIIGHFHKVTMAVVSDLRAKLAKCSFEILETTPLPTLPTIVDAMLRALALLAGENQVDEKPIETIIIDLGLNKPSSKRRLKIFKGMLKKKSGAYAVSASSGSILSNYVTTADLTRAVSVEDVCQLHLLRSLLTAVLDTIDFDLRTYARRYVAAGENVTTLRSAIWSLITRKERNGNIFVSESTKSVEMLTSFTSMWASRHNLSPDHMKRLAYLLQQQSSDPVRWYKAQKDCDVLASCPHPCRLRWYIEPKSLWCESRSERYILVGEADFAFEFACIFRGNPPLQPSSTEAMDEQLVQQALSSLFDPAAARIDVTARDDSSEMILHPVKVAFGVNYRYAGHAAVEDDGFPDLTRLLACQDIDSVVVACSRGPSEGSSVVLLRFYVHETFAQQSGWSMSAFLQHSTKDSALQKKLIRHGSVPLLRMLALREQRKREPVVSLKECVLVGESQAQLALQAVVEASGRCERLVLSTSVAHCILDLIVRRRIDVSYACGYLRALEKFVEESPVASVCEFMNERFERLEDVGHLEPESDVYDVLWLLALRRDDAVTECSHIAQAIVTRVFLLRGVQDERRIFKYCLEVDDAVLNLRRGGDGSFEVIDGGIIEEDIRLCFMKIPNVVQSAIKQSEANDLLPSRFRDALKCTPHETQVAVVEGLLQRFFAVLRTEAGLLALSMSKEVVELMNAMLEERDLSPTMALLAVNHVAFVGDICKHNHVLQRKVSELDLLAHLVGVAWRVENEIVSRKLIDALSAFQTVAVFRHQVVHSLSRLSRPPPSWNEYSLLGEILPESEDGVEERRTHVKRVRRFNQLSQNQFVAAHRCRCSEKAGRRSVTPELRRELVTQTATAFVSAIASRAISLITAGRSWEERVPASQRLLSAAIKFRKAAKIQHTVLRWLYVSRRELRQERKPPSSRRSCGICERSATFVAGVVQYLHSLGPSERIQSVAAEVDATDALLCLRVFVSDHDLCEILVSEFQLHRSLLVLFSSKTQAVRSLATQILSELCWRSPAAFAFTKSRLMRPIWENIAALLKKHERRYCTWIESRLILSVGKFQTPESQHCMPLTKSQNLKQVNRSERDQDMESAASMMMVLSYAHEDFDMMMRVVRIASSNMKQWMTDSGQFTHVKMLLVIQNAMILAPSLSTLSDDALKCVHDFQPLLNDAYANDRVAKSLVLGVIWTMCTCVQIRRQVSTQHPEVLQHALRCIEEILTSSLPPDLSLLPMLLNAAGMAATVSVDCSMKGISPTLIRGMYRLFSSLEQVSPCLDACRSLDCMQADNLSVDSRSGRQSFCAVDSKWAVQLSRFHLLPELGSLRKLNTEELACGVQDQIFRFFAVISSSQMYDEVISNAALQCYVDALSFQVRRGGSSAEFALKTLPHVFRIATTATTSELGTKKLSMTDEQAATIVDLLGNTIQHNSELRKRDFPTSAGIPAMKTIRLVIMALWGLQVASGKAQSLSHSLASELVDLLHSSEEDTKLRLAVLGLLVKMYRVRAHDEGEVQAVPTSSTDRNQVRVLRVITDQVPTIMALLHPFLSSEQLSKIVREMKQWSPLMLDRVNSSAQHHHKLEVVKSVRWPVEVLNLLSESIFIEKIMPAQDYYDVLIAILIELDAKSMRSAEIQGRDEVLLAIARILLVFSRKLALTAAQVDRCIHALFESDSMMTYASDLAAICHRTVEDSRSVDILIRRPERRILVASLRFISTGKLRLDVLSKCLDMVSAFVNAMGEDLCMEQVMMYEHHHGSASAGLFGHIVKIFQGDIKEEVQWAVCRKGLNLLQELVRWNSFLNQIIRGRKTEVHLDEKTKATRTPALESVGLQRSTTHLHDEATRGMIRMALLLVHFKHWLGDVSSAFYAEVLQASAHACRVVATMLQDFQENSKDAASFLTQVADALIHNNQHKVLPSPAPKEPLDALVFIFWTTFLNARTSLHSSFLSREICHLICLSAIQGLERISMHHRARHSAQMTEFFIQNYRSSIFEENDPEILSTLVRLYRRCCCNAFVYRLIRLGRTSLWNLNEDEDDSFYRRLGRSYAKAGSGPDARSSIDNDLRFDIALFLGHQHFSISSLSNSADAEAEERALESPDTLIKRTDESALRLCLRDQFKTPIKVTTISFHAMEFEAGIIEGRGAGQCTAGYVLVNELIGVLQSFFARRVVTFESVCRRTSGDDDTLVLIGLLDQLVSAAEGAAKSSIINVESWGHLLRVVKTYVLSLSELDALLNLLCSHSSRAPSSSATADIAEAVSTRIGAKGIRSFGMASCQATVAFTRKWVATFGHEEISQLLKTPCCLNGIFDVIFLCVMEFENGGELLCQDAFTIVLMVTEVASAANTRILIRQIDQWTATYPHGMSKPSSKATCNTWWQVLNRLILPATLLDQAEWKLAVLRLVERLVRADAIVVVEGLLTNSLIPSLCRQLFEQDRELIKAALLVLQMICRASSTARRLLDSLVRSGVTRPYHDGVLAPLQDLSWGQHTELTPDAYRAQRDQGKVIDLLARQAICANLGPDDIVELSKLVKPARFFAGEGINTWESHPPNLMIVASGVVNWSLTVDRVNPFFQANVHSESTSVSKGGVIGARSLLTLQHKKRYKVTEAAVAVNDVVCLVVDDEVWRIPSVSQKIREAVVRSTGAWHRWLRGESACYIRQLVDLATGELGSDHNVQDRAADVLHQICVCSASSVLENSDVQVQNVWFLSLIMRIVEHNEVSTALRRQVCRLMVELTSVPSYRNALVSLTRRGSRSDGLLILGRAFRQCMIDSECAELWFRVVVLLVQPSLTSVEADPSTGVKVLVRAMTDGDLLKLTSICLASSRENWSGNGWIDPWLVLLLVCDFGGRLQRLIKALDAGERFTLVRRAIIMLMDDSHMQSISLGILAKATLSSEFCIALWSVHQVPGEDRETPDLQYLLKQKAMQADCHISDLCRILEITSKSLKTASTPAEAKQQLVGWTHRIFGADRSPLRRLHDHPPSLSPSESLRATQQICSLVCAIDWCCNNLTTNAARVMARELRQQFAEEMWIVVIETHFLRLLQDENHTRSQAASMLSAMRILYDSRSPGPRQDLELFSQVLSQLQSACRAPSTVPPRERRDPVLLSAWRSFVSSMADGSAWRKWIPRELMSPGCFFETNRAELELLRSTQSTHSALSTRLQVLRGICNVEGSFDGGSRPDEVADWQGGVSNCLVNWLVDIVASRESNAQIVRIAVGCLQNLLHSDGHVREYVALHAEGTLLPQCFGAFADDFRARVSKTRLLQQLCWLANPASDCDSTSGQRASQWMQSVVSIILRDAYEGEMLRRLVNIIDWILSRYRDECFCLNKDSSAVEQMLMHVLEALVSTPFEPTTDPTTTVGAALDGMLVVAHILELTSVHIQEVAVLSKIMKATISWASFLSASTESGFFRSTDHQKLFFICLSVINRSSEDTRYSGQLQNAQKSTFNTLFDSCTRAMTTLSMYTNGERKTVLHSARVAIEALESGQRRVAQTQLQLISIPSSGWMASIASEDVEEQSRATTVLHLMCEHNHEIIAIYANTNNPIFQQLVNNLRRGNELLRPPTQTSGSTQLLPVLQLLIHTAAILCRLVRAQVYIHQLISEPLLEAVETSLLRLTTRNSARGSDVSEMALQASAVKSSVRLLKSCCKHHLAFCRKHLGAKWAGLLKTVTAGLLTLNSYPIDFDRCADILVWVARVSCDAPAKSATTIDSSEFSNLVFSLIDSLRRQGHHQSRCFRAVHALIVMTRKLPGSESLKDVIEARDKAATVGRDIAAVFPRWVCHVDAQVTVDCCALALDLGGAADLIKAAVLQSVETARQGFLNEKNFHDQADSVLERARQVQSLSGSTLVLCTSLSLWGLLLADSKVHGTLDKTGHEGSILWSTVLTGVEACTQANQTTLAGRIARSATNLMRDTHSTAFSFPGQADMTDGLNRMSEMITEAPTWQLAWLLTSFIYRMQPDRSVACLPPQLKIALPGLIARAEVEIDSNRVHGAFHLIGLIVEILRDLVLTRDNENREEDDGTSTWRAAMGKLLMRSFSTRPSPQFSTLVLLGWFLITRLPPMGVKMCDGVITSPNNATNPVESDTFEVISLLSRSTTMQSVSQLVRYQVDQLCRQPPDDPLLVGSCLKSTTSSHRTDFDSSNLTACAPAITLFEYPDEIKLAICVFYSLRIVEQAILDEASHDAIGWVIVEQTTLISDVSRVLDITNALPFAFADTALRVLAGSLRSFRLFTTPVVHAVNISSVSRLILSTDASVSIGAMCTLWQLLRSRQLCHRCVALIRSANSSLSAEEDDALSLRRALQHVKEMVYTVEVDTRRLEAAYGILVQVSKAEESLELVIVMDELHAQSIFLEDPQNILSAVAPSTHSQILLQQCKLLKRLSRWRPQTVLAKPLAIQCLAEAFTIAAADSSGAKAAWLLAVGAALLSLVEATEDVQVSGMENLRDLLEGRQCAVLQGCRDALAWAVQNQKSDRVSRTRLGRVLGLFVSLFFKLTSTKRKLCLLAAVTSSVDSLPQTLLHALHAIRDFHVSCDRDRRGCGEGDLSDGEAARFYMLRILRRLTVSPSVMLLFRSHVAITSGEPFDLLMGLLHHPHSSPFHTKSNRSGDLHIRELFLVILHVSRDPIISSNIATRHDVLAALLLFHNHHAAVPLVDLLWQILHNVVMHTKTLDYILQQISGDDHITVLAQHVDWGHENPHLSSAALAMTSTLRVIAEKTGPRRASLAFVPVFRTLLDDRSRMSTPSIEALIIENVAVALALTAQACADDFKLFDSVLGLFEKLVKISTLEFGDQSGVHVRNGRVTQSVGLPTAIERLVCALCDLLLSFHEDEVNNSFFPGYEIKPVRSGEQSRFSQTPSTSSRDWKRGGHVRDTRVNALTSLSVRSKSNGVFSNGHSPSDTRIVERILEIFTIACTRPVARVRSERLRLRSGRSIGGGLTGKSVLYVSDFFFQTAKTPSGRFFFLNPLAIQFWKTMLPHMDMHSLQKLRDGLVTCTLSKDHVFKFLASGALRLFVTATCITVRSGEIKAKRENIVDKSKTSLHVVDGAFQQLLVAAAVLTERAPFLQSTYYLVYAGAKDGISLAGFVLAAIIYSSDRSPFLKLACKVLSRFLSLFTMEEAAEFLASSPAQMDRALGWEFVSRDDVTMALVSMVQYTESEALMKHRVLVEVVHSTLLRTAVLGLIDKGIPEVLHDYGLKPMMLHMQKLLAASKTLQGTAIDPPSMLNVPANNQVEPVPRRRNSLTGATKTSVERFAAAGLTAVSGAARNAGTLLATTFQEEADEDNSTDPRSRFERRLERCVDALRDVTSEIAEYTLTGYTTVFKSFEKMNDDLELIEAMQSSSHAIALTQASFYVMEILEEALTVALLDDDENDTATGESDANAKSTTRSLEDASDKSSRSKGSAVAFSEIADACVVMDKTEDVLGWITMSLQHSDMDMLFYGSKLMQLGSYAEALLRLPLDEHEDGHGEKPDLQSPESLTVDVGGITSRKPVYPRTHQSSNTGTTRQRIQRTENYPMFLRFRSLELRSWLWSVLGLLPYLRVRHNSEVQLVHFIKAAPKVGESMTDAMAWSREVFREYLCRFEVVESEIDHVETFYRDLPHTVDVEVWMYLPFWPRDVLVSRSKVPLLARSSEDESCNFHFYPESTRGVRSYQPGIIATLAMEFSKQQSKPTEVSLNSNEFPAYSTLGSRAIRRFFRAVWSRVFMWTSDAVSTVAEVTHVSRLMEVAATHRRGRSIVAMQNLSDSLEHEGKDESVTMEESVIYLLTKMLYLLRELTHPDKLVVPAAAQECAPIVDQLETMLPEFSQTLARAFKTKNPRVWRDAVQAIEVVKGLFLTKGLAVFAHSFQYFRHQSTESDKTQSGLSPSLKSPAKRKPSQKESRPSIFHAATSAEARVKKPLRDVMSQLRHVHLHHDSFTAGDDEDGARRVSGQPSKVGSHLLGRSVGRHSASTKRISSRRSRRMSDGSDGPDNLALSALSASAYFQQYSASKTELRMLSPHISVWSLSQARLPEWHSFDRASGPTALNHFLLQPIERLQVYCIVQQYLEQTLKKLQGQEVSTPQPPSTGVAHEAPVLLSRVRSASSIVSKISALQSKPRGQSKEEVRTERAQNHEPSLGLLFNTNKEAIARGPSLSSTATEHTTVFDGLWKKIQSLSGHANRLAIVQKALSRAPEIKDFEHLEAIRARRLLKYHLMDPFDAAARLQRLYQDATRLPTILYREGIVAKAVHALLWALLIATVWRVSIARDAMRDSERSFQELNSSQSSGDNDQIHELLLKRSAATAGGADTSHHDNTPRIVISSRQPRHHLLPASVQRIRRHQVAPSTTNDKRLQSDERDCIVLTQQELKHLVVLLELRSLVSDIFRVWPSENGNIGLNGFWSSLWFTGTALLSPFIFIYAIFPGLVSLNPANTRYLSYVACAYGTAWILAAYVSIRGVTKKIPAFREVRHVKKINLTTLPYCVRNYMAIASVVWEGFQLNTTSFSVWKMSYKPKQLAALTTIDLQDVGLGSLQVNVFESKQTLALVCLLVWFFCLKASNKFKSAQFLNYSLTFLLPNLLGGMLFMFLSKQFYQTAACFENAQNVTVMWANSDIRCWTDPAHTTYALRGMFGMSIFVPLAVLAYGSYQVFFPEVNLDIQTSPLLNVSSQIVKAAMMGALTFFVDKVQLFLAVALVGNLLLLFLVTNYDLCSTWHLKYGKVLIYAMSSWAAFCAMVSTFVRADEEKDRVPLYIMHVGWGVLTLLCLVLARRRMRKQNRAASSGRQVLIKLQQPQVGSWKRKPPSTVTPTGSEQEGGSKAQPPHADDVRGAGKAPV